MNTKDLMHDQASNEDGSSKVMTLPSRAELCSKGVHRKGGHSALQLIINQSECNVGCEIRTFA